MNSKRLGAFLAVLLLVGAAAFAVTLFVRGTRAKPEGPTHPADATRADPPATPFDAAVARARELKLPLLVLVLSLHDDCPPAHRLRPLFAGHSELSDCCVPVEATGGPGTGTAEFQLVSHARRGSTIPPLLAVVTPDLEVLHVQAAHLMCFYDRDGRPALEEDPGVLWGAGEIKQMVQRTMARKAEVDRQLALAPPEDSPDARLTRAELLAEVGRNGEAARLASASAGTDLPMPHLRRVLAVLLRADDATLAQRFADQVHATRSDEPGAGWLLLDARSARAPASAEALARAAERAHLGGEWQLEFRLRAASLRTRAKLAPDAGISAEARALHEQSGEVFHGHPIDHARFLDDLARAAAAVRDVEQAERLIRQLNREHPDTDEAVIYRHGQLDRLRMGLQLR